jgi:hypothetical protein
MEQGSLGLELFEYEMCEMCEMCEILNPKSSMLNEKIRWRDLHPRGAGCSRVPHYSATA